MKENGIPNGFLLSKGHSYYIFILLFLLYLFDYIDRMVVVSLFPFLKTDWGLSDTQCGMLVSAVYWSIILFSFPVSIFIDRWSRKKSIGVMAVLWSFATVACAFTKNFTQLFAARTAIGVGEAGYAPGGTAMISALFPEKKRSIMVGIWNMAIPIGSAIGIALGGFIAVKFGWRHAFGIVALPGLIIAALFFFTKDYKTVDLVRSVNGKKDGSGNQLKMSRRDIIKEFTGTPSLILTYFAFAANTFLTTAMLSWLPTYFNRIQNMPMQQASLKGGSVMLLSIIGFPLGGFLADMWMKKRNNARLLFSALSSVMTSIVFFSAFYFLAGPFQYYLLLLGGISATAFASSAIVVTQDVVHPGLRATSYSLCVIVQNLLGSSIGPLFVGALSDKYNIKTALTVASLSSLVAGILFFIGSFYYDKDLAKVEKIAIKVEE